MGRNKLKHFAQIKEWFHVMEAGDVLPCPWDDRAGSGGVINLELACGKGAYVLGLARDARNACNVRNVRNARDARDEPNEIFIGVDIKGSRVWHGAKRAIDEGLDNVFFLRDRIEDLENYFPAGKVDRIWITFPDPHPREGKSKKRLTSLRFLRIYANILRPGGSLCLKTDDPFLFDWSLEMLESEDWVVRDFTRDLYGDRRAKGAGPGPGSGSRSRLSGPGSRLFGAGPGSGPGAGPCLPCREDALSIKTDYEKRFLEQGKTIKYFEAFYPS